MTKKRKRHTPEQIVKKLRDAEAMKNAENDSRGIVGSPSRYVVAFGLPARKHAATLSNHSALIGVTGGVGMITGAVVTAGVVPPGPTTVT